MQHKTCSTCGLKKPQTSEFFGADKRVRSGFWARCRKCCVVAEGRRRKENLDTYKAKDNARYWSNPEASREYARKRRSVMSDQLKVTRKLAKYGITEETYNVLLAQQGGRCAICKQIPVPDSLKRTLVIDHCHATGTVRGLLCQRCNMGLGLFSDSVQKMSSAIGYLGRFRND